ncbi:MAG: tyrosine--tRNA ligase [Herpetosiphon sp.]|nr:tyrosine--tRNA ligase [Herpetosiphon sp.]
MLTIDEIFQRGVAEIIVESNVRRKLESGKPLRLKLGIDPTKPDMHIGHAVALRKLRQLQDLGHQVVLIVGDWTAQIGDPSGRDETRPRLSVEQTRANAEHYMEQFFKIVSREKTEIRWQSEWFGEFSLADAFNLVGRFTLGQMLSHETFRVRYESGQALTMLELMYPMLQAYDSIAIMPDIEFGGTDQKFNILAGRQLMESMGHEPQDVWLVPLIAGTDGRKMGKSFNNTVDILLPAADKYGKIMSMSDDVLPLYYEVWTDLPTAEVNTIIAQLKDGSLNPRDAKMRLAREIISQIDGADAAAEAEAAFVRVFQQRDIPTDMPEHQLDQPISIVDLLVTSKLASSKGEARRLIDGGGVRINSIKVEGYDLQVQPEGEQIVQVGRRKFLKIRG